jgi:hypothetical protein
VKLESRQLQRLIAREVPAAEIIGHDAQEWNAITLSGARHQLVLRFTGAEAVKAGDLFHDSLPEREFNVPGHLAVEAGITSYDWRSFGGDELLTLTLVIMLLKER